jgi:glyoxylase-like metal-dependent hydrolase (beta-lactamase superfamily II)
MVGAAANGIRPDEIKLIFITHAHLDHYADYEALRDWCGAPVAAHPGALASSQQARSALPPAQTIRGSVIRWAYLLLSPLVPVVPLRADLLLEDGDSLEEYGVSSRVVAVPGHSPDSLAIVTTDGDAFVGDLFANYTVPSEPLYLWNRDVWLASYDRIRKLAPRMVYVGHGDPFGGEKLVHVYPARYQLRWWVR